MMHSRRTTARRLLGFRYSSIASSSIFIADQFRLSFAQQATASPASDVNADSSTLLTAFTAPREVSTTYEGQTSTTSSASSQPTTSNSPLDDNSNSDPEGTDTGRNGLLNYYFVFLAFFVLLILLAAYLFHRKRKARKQRDHTSGQNALARDLDGWTSTRRWMNGHWRAESRAGRDEGLNELGQAPPPYAAKVESPVESPAGAVTGNEPQIPLRSLPRDVADRGHAEPPEYSEAINLPGDVMFGPEDARPITPLPVARGFTDANGSRQRM